jgi:hypothetical protein
VVVTSRLIHSVTSCRRLPRVESFYAMLGNCQESIYLFNVAEC